MSVPPSAASVTVDWLRFTAHWGTSTLPNTFLKASAPRIANKCFPLSTNWKDVKARNGYNVALESVDYAGVTVSWSSNRADMGCSVDICGSALAQFKLSDVLALSVRAGCRVSRIDVAVDMPETLEFDDLYNDLLAGRAVTRSKQYRLVQSNTGATVYVGSRTSEKFLRVYDKGGQTETNVPWTRAELECKGEYAHGVASHLASEGLANIPNIILAFCDFPQVTPWLMWMTSPTLFEGIPQAEKQTNTFKWLMETVAPAFVKFEAENPAFFDQWMQRLVGLGWASSGVGEVDIFDGKAEFD